MRMKCRAYLYKLNILCINFSDGFVSIESATDTIVGEYIGCYLFEDMLSSEKAKDAAYDRYQDGKSSAQHCGHLPSFAGCVPFCAQMS